jgi:hypothetical protein
VRSASRRRRSKRSRPGGQRNSTRATEELLAQGEISDGTWEELSRHLDDERQLIELIMLVGSYATMAWLQNTLRVAYAGGGDQTKASEQYHRDMREIGRGQQA